jgi:hypothetical protein
MKDFEAFFELHKKEIVSYAKSNTRYNAEGKATISKEEDWFYDDVWEHEHGESKR